METQKTLIAKTILRMKNELGQSHSLTSDCIQSYRNQNSVVLAQTQTHRSMEENIEPKNKPMHLWSPNL